ncbi:MAG TPA: DNA translocase FtsK 4TM domain-containing protein, partial [Clostridia bacterium]|nr:DNA translocase FtsK 4TM domain-containing protein [Clostridia bacterium]
MKKSAKRKKNKAGDRTPEQTKREVLGVLLIALGLFIGTSLYSDAVGLVGAAIRGFFFGMTGFFGYAIPVALLAWGMLVIVFSERPVRPLTTFLVVVFLISLLSAVHVGARDSIESIKTLAYYKDAYTYGQTYRAGGGFLGALLAYPALLLMGEVGSYIVFAAAMLIAFLLTTRLSIKRTGEKLTNGIKLGVDAVSERISERRQTLYTEDLYEPEPIRQKPVQPKGSRGKKAPPPREDPYRMEPIREEYVAGDPRKVKNARDELEFLPTSGALERKPNQEERLARDFDNMCAMAGEERFVGETGGMPDGTSRISRNAPPAPKQKSAASAPIAAEKPPEHVPIVYQRPPYDLLNPVEAGYIASESPLEKAKLLEETLATFNISARVINYSVGPVITRFELQPAKGVRVNRITSLSQDLALALAAQRVRIEAPIPGKQAIGIEIPNKNTAKVLLREVVESREFQGEKSSIAFALGKDIAGKNITADLDKMPHMLIAGATGSGKSVCINDIIISMAYKSSPEDLRMVLIDPKVVEMRMYAPLPHLLLPVVTDAKKAAGALRWTVMEMERRYKLIAELNARDLARYNQLAGAEGEHLPKLVVVIDELADLMMVAAKEVEDSICRIAQLGRAAGIHMIVATQRPSTDVITGLIKANIPSRIAFAVSSAVDSRVILDEGGAEKLLGKGDMLFHANGASKPQRAQAALVTDEEVERVMDFFTEHVEAQPMREDDFEKIASAATQNAAQGNGKQEDDLLPEAV